MSDIRPANPVSHAAGPSGTSDYTLCGIGIEGVPWSNELPPPVYAKRGEPITCPQCTTMIRYCREEFQSAAIAGLFRNRAGRAR